MSEKGERMFDKAVRPDAETVAQWIGSGNYQRWLGIQEFIEKHYPGVFPPEDWLFGGKKHGWGLRYKKSKSFCTLIPERDGLAIVIVLGRAEREKAELILDRLSPEVRRVYEEAKTYHDGKWLLIAVDKDDVLEDIKQLLVIKRKPKVF